MAHGAGGKATSKLVEGLLQPAFGMDARGRRAGRRRRDHHRRVRGQAAALPGRLDRRARGQRDGQRPGDGRRATGGAHAQPDPRRGPGERRAARRGRRDRARGRSGRRADRRRRHEGRRARPRRRHVHHHDRPRARATRGRRSRRRGPATGSCSPARSPPTARRSCSRAASSTSKPTSSPTRGRCGPRSTPCSGRASAQLRDATRGGVASVLNELARAAGVAMLIQEAAVPVAPAVAGACELLGIDPMHVANEGVFVAIVAPDVVGATASPTSARSRPSRPAWCWSRRASAASA